MIDILPACVGPFVEELEPHYRSEIELIEARLGSDYWRKIDQIDDDLATIPEDQRASMPVQSTFTKGGYMRSCFLPKGTLLTTRIHTVEHPFVISMGIASVWEDGKGWKTLRGVHHGVTHVGTRRVILVHEDTIWTTFWPNPEGITDPDEMVRRVTYCGGKFYQLGAAGSTPSLQ